MKEKSITEAETSSRHIQECYAKVTILVTHYFNGKAMITRTPVLGAIISLIDLDDIAKIKKRKPFIKQ